MGGIGPILGMVSSFLSVAQGVQGLFGGGQEKGGTGKSQVKEVEDNSAQIAKAEADRVQSLRRRRAKTTSRSLLGGTRENSNSLLGG